MASVEFVEQKLLLAKAQMQRGVDVKELTATIVEFERSFRGTPDQDFSRAVDRWIGSFDGDCYSLPTTGQIWTHLKALRSAGDDRRTVGRGYQPPRAEFMEQMRDVHEALGWASKNRKRRLSVPRVGMNLEAIKPGLMHEHIDRHPETNRWGRWVELDDDTEEWKQCPKCEVMDRRKGEIAKQLERMPEPGPQLSACQRGGRCDGSGFVDRDGDPDRLVRRCKSCNPDPALT